jgi:hypothetical protein
MNGFGTKYLKRRAALLCAFAAALLAFPAAAFAAADAGVEGHWLRISNFPEDAAVVQFEDDGEGTVKYMRALNGDELLLGIYRMPFPSEPTAENMEKIFESLRKSLEDTIEENGGDADDLAFEASDEFSEYLGYACRTAEYNVNFKTGARWCADLYAIGEGYVFMVKLSVDEEVEDDYAERAREWFMNIKISDGEDGGKAAEGEAEDDSGEDVMGEVEDDSGGEGENDAVGETE